MPGKARFVWNVKGFEFERATLERYDAQLIVDNFFRNYGPWLKKKIEEWQRQIQAENQEGR